MEKIISGNLITDIKDIYDEFQIDLAINKHFSERVYLIEKGSDCDKCIFNGTGLCPLKSHRINDNIHFEDITDKL